MSYSPVNSFPRQRGKARMGAMLANTPPPQPCPIFMAVGGVKGNHYVITYISSKQVEAVHQRISIGRILQHCDPVTIDRSARICHDCRICCKYNFSTESRAQGVRRRNVRLDLILGSCVKQRTGTARAIASQPIVLDRCVTMDSSVIPSRLGGLTGWIIGDGGHAFNLK